MSWDRENLAEVITRVDGLREKAEAIGIEPLTLAQQIAESVDTEQIRAAAFQRVRNRNTVSYAAEVSRLLLAYVKAAILSAARGESTAEHQ